MFHIPPVFNAVVRLSLSEFQQCLTRENLNGKATEWYKKTDNMRRRSDRGYVCNRQIEQPQYILHLHSLVW